MYPLPERDASKLLVYRNGQIFDRIFNQLDELLPDNALLIFNDTKVIHARIQSLYNNHVIEIFCLEPIDPWNSALNFEQREHCVWKCFVGNNRRWKAGLLTIETTHETVRITRQKPIDNAWLVHFQWNSGRSFAEILETIGKMPLPPYIHRDADADDEVRYQTIFAEQSGSVAAPTASLHFTETMLQKLCDKHIETHKLTLHVGAGTFKPVTTPSISDHLMHSERVMIGQPVIHSIINAIESGRSIIPVGTTSLRSIESLFWLDIASDLSKKNYCVEQWTPYTNETAYAQRDVVKHLKMLALQESITFQTSLLIAPTYCFHIANGIITNFHQPCSTLLLLIAALIGDSWKSVYSHALAQDYRFLSYGDSCLFLP